MRTNSRGKLSGAVRNLILQCAKSEASYLGIILSEPETTAHGSSIHSDPKSQISPFRSAKTRRDQKSRRRLQFVRRRNRARRMQLLSA